MYRKLEKGMSGIEFVETFFNQDFEKFLEEESHELRDEQTVDLNHFILPNEEIDFSESMNLKLHPNIIIKLILNFCYRSKRYVFGLSGV